MQVSGAQHSKFGSSISTDDASWRGSNTETGGKSAFNNVQVGGPQHSEIDPQFLQTMQVGKRAQHSEIGFPISTDDASWGNGPNIVKWILSFY